MLYYVFVDQGNVDAEDENSILVSTEGARTRYKCYNGSTVTQITDYYYRKPLKFFIDTDSTNNFLAFWLTLIDAIFCYPL